MTTLREAAQQALEFIRTMNQHGWMLADYEPDMERTVADLEAALAEPVQEPDLSRCPQCGGPADNGHDRCLPPNPYHCTKCVAEPATLDAAMAVPLSLAKAYENGWNAAKAEQGEPVAWMDIDSDGNRLSVRQWSDGNRDEVPLYTAPPRCAKHDGNV